MLRNTNKEWERRKWYLVRSLFDNEPLLSPIPETQEQSLSPADVARSRPYSPLPDLIIEKEPNRHDEPEEYYQELEKKIKKIYRRLFRKIRKSQDSSIEDIYEINVHGTNMEDETIEERTQSEHSSVGKRQSSDIYSREETKSSDEKSESTDSSSNKRVESKDSINSSSVKRSSNKVADSSSIENVAINASPKSSSTDTSEANSNSSDESSMAIEHDDSSKLFDRRKSTRSTQENDTSSLSISHHETIVTTAQIHDSGSKQLVETISYIYPATVLDKTSRDEETVIHYSLAEKTEEISTDINAVSTNTGISEAVDEQSEELESLQSSASPDEIERPCPETDSSSLDEPETMRRRGPSNISLQSANAADYRRCSSTADELVELSGRQMEEAEATADFSLILGSSTPKMTSQEQRYSKRRILSEIFTSHEVPKRSKQNLATQTSFSTTDDENDWQEIRATFFEGTPCIYKLCSCSNHVCS